MSAEQSFEKGRTQEKKDDTGEQDEAKKTENQIARTQLTRTANPNFTVINMNVGQKDKAISDQEQRKNTLEGILTSQRPSLVFVQELEGIGLNQTPFNDEVRNIYSFFRDDQVIVPNGGNRENIISKKPGFYYHHKVVECELLDELSVKRCFTHVKTTLRENLQDSMVRNVFNRLCLCKITNKQIPTFELLCACWHGVYKDSIKDRAKALHLMLRFLLILKVQYKKLPLLLAGDFNLIAQEVGRLIPPNLVMDSPYDESYMLWIRSRDFDKQFGRLYQNGVDYPTFDHVVLKMEIQQTSTAEAIENEKRKTEESKDEMQKPMMGTQKKISISINVGQEQVIADQQMETLEKFQTSQRLSKPGIFYDKKIIDSQLLDSEGPVKRCFNYVKETFGKVFEGHQHINSDILKGLWLCKTKSEHPSNLKLLVAIWHGPLEDTEENQHKILNLFLRFLLTYKVECGNLPVLLVGDFNSTEIDQLISHNLVLYPSYDKSKLMWILSDDFNQTFEEIHTDTGDQDAWKIEFLLSTLQEQISSLVTPVSSMDSCQIFRNKDYCLKIRGIQRHIGPAVQVIVASWYRVNDKAAAIPDKDKNQSFRWTMRFLVDEVNRRDPSLVVIGVNTLTWVLKGVPYNDELCDALDTWIISNDHQSLLKVKRKNQKVDQMKQILPFSKTSLKAEIKVHLDIISLKLESKDHKDYIVTGNLKRHIPKKPAEDVNPQPNTPQSAEQPH